jgi:hypothetical protein
MVFRACLLGFFLLALLAGCSGDTVYTTNFASGFAPSHHAVSVLGVYKDGRMSSEAWDAIGPRVSRSLGSANCESAYAEAAASSNRPLWEAIDEYTRNDGPTDALLGKVAPAARGDLVLVVTVAGKLPTQTKVHLQDEPAPSTTSSMGRGGGGMGGMGGGGQYRNPNARSRAPDPSTTEALDLQASLFSVSEGKSVGLVGLQYTGQSLDEALARFGAKLQESLPAATCVGWNWEAKIDPEAIRQSIGQEQ